MSRKPFLTVNIDAEGLTHDNDPVREAQHHEKKLRLVIAQLRVLEAQYEREAIAIEANYPLPSELHGLLLARKHECDEERMRLEGLAEDLEALQGHLAEARADAACRRYAPKASGA